MSTPFNTSGSGRFSTEEAILDVLEGARATAAEALQEGKNYVRKDPVCAVSYAVVAGYLLRFLPIGGLLRLLAGIVISSLRPLALIYGLAKIYEQIQRLNAGSPRASVQRSDQQPL